jgi:lipopolysaccharide/colanic/teichoic acid biosynthesis glycosyltransferase
MIKRSIDVAVAGLGLVILLPVLAAIAAAVWFESGRPVLFRQVRIGKDMEPFVLLKFRSMVTDREGPAITAAGDERTTRVGRFLRETKLDELPQLINVLRGDMSLVGPRPELPEYVALYEESFRRILTIRPGITGSAALAFSDEERYLAGLEDAEKAYAEEILPQKLALDEAYVSERTLRTDVAILTSTLGSLLSPRRARNEPGPADRADQS